MGTAPEADKKENNKAAAEDWVGHPTVTPPGYQKLAFTQSCSPFCFTCQLISTAALGAQSCCTSVSDVTHTRARRASLRAASTDSADLTALVNNCENGAILPESNKF